MIPRRFASETIVSIRSVFLAAGWSAIRGRGMPPPGGPVKPEAGRAYALRNGLFWSAAIYRRSCVSSERSTAAMNRRTPATSRTADRRSRPHHRPLAPRPEERPPLKPDERRVEDDEDAAAFRGMLRW